MAVCYFFFPFSSFFSGGVLKIFPILSWAGKEKELQQQEKKRRSRRGRRRKVGTIYKVQFSNGCIL